MNAPAFAEDVREFTVPISIRSVDGRYTWDDRITLQFFRESMTMSVPQSIDPATAALDFRRISAGSPM